MRVSDRGLGDAEAFRQLRLRNPGLLAGGGKPLAER